MLYCERCGQSKYIDNECFISWVHVSGTEKQYLDSDTGEVIDNDGMEDTDYGDTETECPHCHSTSVEFEWDGTEEESFNQRARWERERAVTRRRQEQEELVYTIKNLDWDLDTNSVHK
jgi:hypothetical protein